jgi:hypothetical protein
MAAAAARVLSLSSFTFVTNLALASGLQGLYHVKIGAQQYKLASSLYSFAP